MKLKWKTGLVVLISLAGCICCPAQNYDFYKKQAYTCFDKGEYEKARKALNVYNKMTGNKVTGLSGKIARCVKCQTLAKEAESSGDYASAKSYYESILECNPKDPNASATIARLNKLIAALREKERLAAGSVMVYSMTDIDRVEHDKIVDGEEVALAKKSNLKRGGQFFADLGYAWLNGCSGTGASASFGYQFSPIFYAGLGVEVTSFNDPIEERCGNMDLPVFADLRLNFMNRKNSPFINIKTGYQVIEAPGVYANTSLGYRFGFKERRAMIFSAGFLVQPSGYEFYNYYEEYDLGFNVKLGVEF